MRIRMNNHAANAFNAISQSLGLDPDKVDFETIPNDQIVEICSAISKVMRVVADVHSSRVKRVVEAADYHSNAVAEHVEVLKAGRKAEFEALAAQLHAKSAGAPTFTVDQIKEYAEKLGVKQAATAVAEPPNPTPKTSPKRPVRGGKK